MNSLPSSSMDYSPGTPRPSLSCTPSPVSDSNSPFASPSPTEEKASQVFQNILPIIETSSQSAPSYSRTTILIDRPDFIFLDIPAGKPEPTAPCSPVTLQFDDRPRTDQSNTKNGTCWYYALNMIRQRIGKHPSPELQIARGIEATISSVRKKYTDIYSCLPSFYLAIERDPLATKEMKKENVAALLDHWEDYADYYDPETSDFSMKADFQAFLAQEQYDRFGAFRQAKIDALEDVVTEQFFQAATLNPQSFFERSKQTDPINHRHHFQNAAWEDLDISSRSSLMHAYLIYTAAAAYGLKISNWSPFQPIESLIQTLKVEGPLVVGGYFFFSKMIQSKEKIPGRIIYTPDPQVIDSAHMVTIVGAKIDPSNGGTVFYLDPNLGSAPGAPKKVYTLPFDSLKNLIMNHFHCNSGDLVESPTRYAWVKGP